MSLTSNEVAKHVGGEVKILSTVDNYIYRGKIEKVAIDVNGETLQVLFSLKNKDGQIPPDEWRQGTEFDYVVDLVECAIEIEDTHISLFSPLVGEVAILSLPRGQLQ